MTSYPISYPVARSRAYAPGRALLGTPWPLPISGFTLNSDGYLVSNADGSLWVFDIDSDGVFGIDSTGAYYIEAA